MTKHKTIYGLILTAVLSVSACQNLETLPEDRYAQETFWRSANAAYGGLVGCYSTLISRGLYGEDVVLLEEATSPNAYNYNNVDGWSNIALGTHNASNTNAIAARWRAAYTMIGRCNALIEGIDGNVELTPDAIVKMKAEARFLRALSYHVLTIYFNDVPLITATPDLDQVTAPRKPRAQVVDFILGELDAIAAILPPAYTVATEKGRATSGAAQALKARILLFEASPLFTGTGDAARWRRAADAAKAVMDLNRYSLFPNYRALFSLANEYNAESIFDIQFQGPNVGSSFDVTLRQYNTCAPVRELIEAYRMKDGQPRSSSTVTDPGNFYSNMDPRFYQTVVYPGATFMGATVSNTRFVNTGYTFKKYSVYDAGAASTAETSLGERQSGINYMLFRYADVLLMYAEAKNELNELTPDVWNATIRAIRQRAGFTDAAALTYPAGAGKAEFTDIIRYERRIEFAGEGFYYNDIRRWKTAETVLNATIRKYDNTPIIVRKFEPARNYLWPVPQIELERNPNLTQNPGGY
ncbi:RagB/SusD family nutrient uptake outer membrane protein [Pedobacter yulinensis]|uniref:RagB/SusD family nutrient uptake outer membrane protein n=2 Tax=Pedobacter yulinensis TaxID=2126353 RepID=A0A2T3HPB7_9SPHI|nr:RagB/SusD family nutrient uptake outer membrane protein [Pedobacter yulinensis]